jgi:hypothetical protein
MNSIHLRGQRPQTDVADSRKTATTLDEFAYLLNSRPNERAFLRVRTQLTAP